MRKDLHIAALDALAESEKLRSERETALEKAGLKAETLTEELGRSEARTADALSQRDGALADNQALREQVKKMGGDIGTLTNSSAALSREVQELRALREETLKALEEAAQRAEAAAERDAILGTLRERLKSMIDGGQLDVRIQRGRMVIDLKQDILFPSGKAVLSPLGEDTLGKVAQVLATFPKRSFQVEGHTDNVPIKTDRFSSNWELSTARAVAVVKLFVARGLSPERVSAAGYGEYQPRADNASAEGQALNRRIEVVMLPDLQSLPDLVEGL